MFEKHGASGYKASLRNTLALDKHFGHPHRSYKTIHVAGTNGKGSVSHTIASVLQHCGYRVGLYTSPHLVDFRERVRVNGEMMPEDYVVGFVEEERSFFEPLRPSFFEVTTALAFKYFRDAAVDIAVVEVGLGGRIDCTNIISPLVSVITNISFDHTQFLGTTLAAIAGEKAGIIKSGVPVVVGEANKETRPVFEAKAADVSAPIVFAEDNMEVISCKPSDNGGIDYVTRSYGTLHGDLGGIYQQKNMNTVLATLDVLLANKLIDNLQHSRETLREAVSTVVATTGLMGRWQTLCKNPLVICDTGHNVGGWEYLSRQIATVPCRHLRVVFGMVADKDIDGVLALLPKDAEYYFTKPANKRALDEYEMLARAKKNSLHGRCFATVKGAYAAAFTDATATAEDDFIFVGGSSYVVADLLSK